MINFFFKKLEISLRRRNQSKVQKSSCQNQFMLKPLMTLLSHKHNWVKNIHVNTLINRMPRFSRRCRNPALQIIYTHKNLKHLLSQLRQKCTFCRTKATGQLSSPLWASGRAGESLKMQDKHEEWHILAHTPKEKKTTDLLKANQMCKYEQQSWSRH